MIVGKFCDVELKIFEIFCLEDVKNGDVIVEFERFDGCKEFFEFLCVNDDGMFLVIFIFYELGEYLIYVYKCGNEV